MSSDKLDASTVINMSSLYLYCKEIKIKNLEHSKNSPLLVLSPPLPFPPWLQNSPYFYVFKCVGTVKQKGLEWDCVQVQHTFFRFLCYPMGMWCSCTSLAWDCYSYTSTPPPPKMNKRYCVPSNKSQSHFQNNSCKWKHDWTCLNNNGFLTLTVTWDVQNFQKKETDL